MDWLLESTESFCQERAVFNAVMDSIAILDGKDKNRTKNSIPEILSEALGVSFDSHIGHDFIEDFESRYDYYHRVEEKIAFDLELLNKITRGGLSRKSLNIILAGTGVGKTLAMCHFAAANLSMGKNVLYITMEMAEEKIAERIDANLLNIASEDLQQLPRELYENKIARLKTKTQGKLIIKEYPTKTASTSVIKNHLKRIASSGQKIDMIIVDYGDLLNPTVRYKEKRTELETIYEELRAIAMEFICPVWTASQTNRSGLNAEVVTMESISEAFNKCFVADFIFSVSRTVDDKKTNSGRIFIAKNRNGPDGIVMPLYMDTSVVKMEVLEDQKPENIIEAAKAKKPRNKKQEIFDKFRTAK